ncbi:MAG: hypothetical protein WD382_04385 [Halofilum sp. (in: g-proteobacteria)]
MAALAGALLLAGAPHPGAAASPSRFEIVIEDGRPSEPGRTLLVSRGERVAIVVHSDESLLLHLHGYDREFEVPAGGNTTLHLDADITGRFPVEAHHAKGHGALFYLQVRPD